MNLEPGVGISDVRRLFQWWGFSKPQETASAFSPDIPIPICPLEVTHNPCSSHVLLPTDSCTPRKLSDVPALGGWLQGGAPGLLCGWGGWAVASTVPAEKLNSIVHVCAGVAPLNGKLLLRKRRSDHDLSRSDSLASNFSWLKGWEKWEKNSIDKIAFYNASKTSESHRLSSICPAPQIFLSLLWSLTPLVPQGAGRGREMQTTLTISRPAQSHIQQGTRSADACVAWSDSSWRTSATLPQLAYCQVNQAVPIPSITQLRVGQVRVLQTSPQLGHLPWRENTNHQRSLDIGFMNYSSFKEVKNSCFTFSVAKQRETCQTPNRQILFQRSCI